MYIIVPNSLTGLPRVLNDLSDLRLELTNLREYQVDVTLPKFKFEYTSQLDGVLREVSLVNCDELSTMRKRGDAKLPKCEECTPLHLKAGIVGEMYTLFRYRKS